MATMLPPVYGAAFEFDVVLFAQSDNQIKTTPTIASGDFVISKSNGATASLTTTPSESPASSGIVRVQVSATEMQADKVTVKWHDAAGAEWHDGAVCIHTTGQTFNTMDTNIDNLPTAAAVWTYSPRTLTSTAAQVTAAVTGSDLSIHRGDSFSASLTGLGDIQARTQLYWTVKDNTNRTDAKAAVQVEEGDGLVYLKGAAVAIADALNGDITVTNAVTGALTLTLAAESTAELIPGEYFYDIQMVTASGVETLTEGGLTVVADVTRATA